MKWIKYIKLNWDRVRICIQYRLANIRYSFFGVYFDIFCFESEIYFNPPKNIVGQVLRLGYIYSIWEIKPNGVVKNLVNVRTIKMGQRKLPPPLFFLNLQLETLSVEWYYIWNTFNLRQRILRSFKMHSLGSLIYNFRFRFPPWFPSSRTFLPV